MAATLAAKRTGGRAIEQVDDWSIGDMTQLAMTANNSVNAYAAASMSAVATVGTAAGEGVPAGRGMPAFAGETAAGVGAGEGAVAATASRAAGHQRSGTGHGLFRVRKRTLLAIAGCVWLIAGYNVARMGVIAYAELSSIAFYLPILSVLVFIAFRKMFLGITRKHGARIRGMQEPTQPFWRFFDAKSYAIMAVMMGGGFGMRASGLVPGVFIAFFYTGLGIALALTGITFLRMFFSWNKDNTGIGRGEVPTSEK